MGAQLANLYGNGLLPHEAQAMRYHNYNLGLYGVMVVK